jgi:hypothetical protein
MEDRDVFTFRNRGIVLWLAGVLLVSLVIGAVSPPAFWLAPIGILFIIVGGLAHSFRTEQWYTWERWELRLNWFEGWAASTGGVLFAAALASFFFVR